ncbi:hypothetical protein Micbo1qcDRAFT_190455 [Microdochium bolleyi]|uniref:MutL C-terminal dimerisation domain-containing protein n=1 Tax=Microdochium bolleyi TaxID=196109 RepID=A0A136INZ0_9PEZI|nr:hypothetical protein Micbo1qcDRAFT_190455 [Microdochium bolleyi]
MQQNTIQRLPEHVIAQIKSSTAIVTLNDAIVGLLKNSLDAGATKIQVSVDFARGSCTVDDNGTGILPSDFTEQGGIGKIYHSSRCSADAETHGQHGVFLASLAALSLLTITSHHQGHHSHNAIRLHRAEVIARHTPALPEQRFLTFDHGTRVAVRDLFGAMPVRIKQRALDAGKGVHARDLDLLKHQVAAVLLAWPRGCVVTIHDKGAVRDLASRLSTILASAQLVEDTTPDTWVEIRASSNGLAIHGAVNLRPVATKHVQFISLGITPVQNNQVSNPLYEEVNRIFASSDFETTGRKRLERWPMFFLQVDIPIGTTAHEHEILRLLGAVLKEFLVKYNLRPKLLQRRKDTFAERQPSIGPAIAKPASPLLELPPRSRSAPRSSDTTGDLATTQLDLNSLRRLRSQIRWRNPATGRVSMFDARTGLAFADDSGQPAHQKPQMGEPLKKCRLATRPVENRPTSPWLGELMHAWKNPVFPVTENSIPMAKPELETRFAQRDLIVQSSDGGKLSRNRLSQAQVVSQVDQKFILAKLPVVPAGEDHAGSGYSLVIVDQHAADERCRVEALMREYFQPESPGHAGAVQTWRAVTEALEQPLRFEISSQDSAKIQAARPFFEKWAIIYNVVPLLTSVNNVKPPDSWRLEVSHLPPSIFERCRSEPRLLIEMLREEAWKLHGSHRVLPNIHGATPDGAAVNKLCEAGWLSRLHGCPQGILDMINSRACRSAIMFNDVLSHTECQDLLSRLSHCAFPFQCAHGRPSVAPLLSVENCGTVGLWDRGKTASFGKAYRKWTTKS